MLLLPPASPQSGEGGGGKVVRIDDGKELLANISTASSCGTRRRFDPDADNGGARTQASTVSIK